VLDRTGGFRLRLGLSPSCVGDLLVFLVYVWDAYFAFWYYRFCYYRFVTIGLWCVLVPRVLWLPVGCGRVPLSSHCEFCVLLMSVSVVMVMRCHSFIYFRG